MITVKGIIKVLGQTIWEGDLIYKTANILNGEIIEFPQELLTEIRKANTKYLAYYGIILEHQNFRLKIEKGTSEFISGVTFESLDADLAVELFKDFVTETLSQVLESLRLIEYSEV